MLHFHASDPGKQWEIGHQMCVESVLDAGAKWCRGRRVRGTEPVFVPYSPSAPPRKSPNEVRLCSLLAKIRELQFRFARSPSGFADAAITRDTWLRVQRVAGGLDLALDGRSPGVS